VPSGPAATLTAGMSANESLESLGASEGLSPGDPLTRLVSPLRCDIITTQTSDSRQGSPWQARQIAISGSQNVSSYTLVYP
jgi:hypothetical protein